MDRRAFLKGAGILAGAVVAGTLTEGCAAPVKAVEPAPRRAAKKPRSGIYEVDGLPVADWVVAENRRKGTLDWAIHPTDLGGAMAPWPAAIEGYANRTSYQIGDQVVLYVNTTASQFRADVYRMGYYQGLGGRLVDRTAELPGRVQPIPPLVPGINMIECDWQPSATLKVTPDWMPGTYLVKLVASHGRHHYIPFVVRDDASTAAIAVMSGVTTWQAYNLWGGYSLYGGGNTGALADRSRIVSFDRPYRNSDQNGSGGFLGVEYPFVYLAERHGLDVTYLTDVDLHQRPTMLANHKCLVSLGHDEYWSWQMRFDGVMNHLPRGLNVAFLGANASYRQIRFEASPTGPDRRVICYKDASEDPILAATPRLATGGSWSTDPVPYPESEMIGTMYQAYGANSPFVVTDASSWVYAGTGLHDGEKILGPSGGQQVVGSEFDGFEPSLRGPKNVEILAHSPTSSVDGDRYSDASYYTVPGGGGVFATGTANWVQLLWDGYRPLQNALGFGVSPTRTSLTQISLNVLAAFSKGAASIDHVANANWRRFYSPTAAALGSVDTP